MDYIHQKPTWPSFYWEDAALLTQLANIRHQQGFLQGKMSELGFDTQTIANLDIQTQNILKTSEIEGEILSHKEVRSSVAKHLGIENVAIDKPSRAIEGLVAMMLDATENYDTPLNKNRLFGWHSSLFPDNKSGWYTITTGAWRPPGSGPMQVISGALGNEKVHFEAPLPERLDQEMSDFLSWFNSADLIDPLIKAGIAHFWFVTIHPFDDGNGRIARAIADMCLAKADQSSLRFYSMSAQIEKERKRYYAMLERSQKGDLDLTPWLHWFLSCLESSIDGAQTILDTTLHKNGIWKTLNNHPINDRQKKVVNRLFRDFEGKLTTKKYAKIAACSHDTALRDIQQLIAFGIMLQDEGSGRSTAYSLRPLDKTH